MGGGITTPAADPRTLTGRVLGQITDRPCSPMTLAWLCDAKELAIDQVLAQLHQQGLATPTDNLSGVSRRDLCWRAGGEAAPAALPSRPVLGSSPRMTEREGKAAPVLTADLVAAAVIAAARALGVDPIGVFSERPCSPKRLALSAAASGLCAAFDNPRGLLRRCTEVLGVAYMTVATARSQPTARFALGSQAAMRAVELVLFEGEGA